MYETIQDEEGYWFRVPPYVVRPKGYPITCDRIGPYRTQKELAEGKRGFRRFIRNNPESRRTKEKLPMQITRAEAIELCESLGIVTAKKWSKTEMHKRLKQLGDSLDEDSELENEDLRPLLKEVLAADEVEVVKQKSDDSDSGDDDETAEEEAKPARSRSKKKPEKKSGGSKKKVAAKSDDDEDDKPAKKKSSKKKPATKKKRGVTTKEKVWKAWCKKKKPTGKHAEAVRKAARLTDDDISIATVKSYIGVWRSGKQLPLCAKEGSSA